MTLLDAIDACDAPEAAKALMRSLVDTLTEEQRAALFLARGDDYTEIGTRSVRVLFHDGEDEVSIAGHARFWRFASVAELLTGVKGGGDGWVSVGERLPEERDEEQPDCSVDVLMARNGRVLRGYYDHAFKAWYDHCGPGSCRNVTHWRPLPEPPGGGE